MCIRDSDRLDAELIRDSTLHSAFEALTTSQTPYPDGRVPKRILIDGGGSTDQVAERVLTATRAHFGISIK